MFSPERARKMEETGNREVTGGAGEVAEGVAAEAGSRGSRGSRNHERDRGAMGTSLELAS
jgi:hypothetical protein